MPQYIAITAINNIFLTKGFLFPLKFPTLDIFLNLSDLQIRKVQESGNFSSNLLLGFGGGGNRGAEIKKGGKTKLLHPPACHPFAAAVTPTSGIAKAPLCSLGSQKIL